MAKRRVRSPEGRPCLRSIVVTAGLSVFLPPLSSLFVPASLPAAVLFLAPAPARAQVVQGTSILVEVPRLATLGISGDVSTLLTKTQDGSGEAKYDAGCIESAADVVTLTCTTNSAWDLGARITGPWSCPAGYDKQEKDLFLRVSSHTGGTIRNGSDQYFNPLVSDQIVLSGVSGTLATKVTIQHKILLDWARDIPGPYSITVTYTLTDHLP